MEKVNYIGIIIEGSLEIFEAKDMNEVKTIVESGKYEDINPELYEVIYVEEEFGEFDIKHYTKNNLIRRM